MSRLARRGAVAAGALGALAILVAVGSWEQSRNAREQNRRMGAIYRLATSDGILSKRLYAYRFSLHFDCLIYSVKDAPSAFELCFDPHGRLVETVDRRSTTPHFATLREQPALATLRMPPRTFLHVLAAKHLFGSDPRLDGESPNGRLVPTGYDDIGARPFPSLPPSGGTR